MTKWRCPIKVDPQQFRSLMNHLAFISNRGHVSFTSSRDHLRLTLQLDDDLFTEISLSANSIGNTIRRVLEELEISVPDLKIFLRRDCDASESPKLEIFTSATKYKPFSRTRATKYIRSELVGLSQLSYSLRSQL